MIKKQNKTEAICYESMYLMFLRHNYHAKDMLGDKSIWKMARNSDREKSNLKGKFGFAAQRSR